MSQTEFFKESQKITSRFLQTVVAVDDNLKFSNRATGPTDEELKVPEEGLFGDFGVVEYEASGPLSHELHYQELSHEFAELGIVCGGFKPVFGDTKASLDAVVTSSKNADITILDWQMKSTGNDGDFAIKTIECLAESDISEFGRTRLICIYTAEAKEKVEQVLIDRLKKLNPSKKERSIYFETPYLSHWKIEVVSKEIREKQLCDELIKSFTELTAGLLSNAALASIASIRDNTHNLLHRFNNSLDSAYLSHVLGLISSPKMREQAHDVAFDYAVDLISEELKSELQINDFVKKSLSSKALQSWPSFVAEDEDESCFVIELGSKETYNLNAKNLESLLTGNNLSKTLEDIGVAQRKRTIQTANKIKRKLANESDEGKIDSILNESNALTVKEKMEKPERRFEDSAIQLSFKEQSEKPSLDLCAIESTRRCISSQLVTPPSLKQGTIIKSFSDNAYYVCVQPVCDSVRLRCSTSFTFIKVREADGNNNLTHVLRSDLDSHLKLSISCKATTIRTFNFMPDSNTKTVIGSSENGKHVYKEDSSKERFEWCGELKQSVAQSIVNTLAAQLSRVGLDTFEWLRHRQMN